MKHVFAAALASVVLVGCASLPSSPVVDPDDPTPSLALQSLVAAPTAQLTFCETNGARESCAQDSQGLKASGLGGVFIPLDTTLSRMTLRANEADFDIEINGLDASCATAPVTLDSAKRTIKASGFYCNWAGIGNVLATLELTADWQDEASDTFGGRYRLQFNGTGNGAGSGTYRASVQK